MRKALLFFVLSLPLAASAQKLVASHPSIAYHVGSDKAFLYRSAADTANKSKFSLSPGEEALVVGEYSPRWAVVNRGGFLYLTPTKALTNYSSGDTQALPRNSQTGRITYEGVVQVDGVSKADLFTRANAWAARTYRSANDVIQLNDKEAGQLILKGNSRVSSRGSDFGVVRHTLTIYVKDGRYKYVLTDLTHDAAGARNVYSAGPLEQPQGHLFTMDVGNKKPWEDIRMQATRDARRLIASLESTMTLKGAKDPSDF
jgi:hypothetical protein